jgi:hypothetical protein
VNVFFLNRYCTCRFKFILVITYCGDGHNEKMDNERVDDNLQYIFFVSLFGRIMIMEYLGVITN